MLSAPIVDPGIQNQVNAIIAWNLDAEKRYMVNKKGVKTEEANDLEEEFKKYLILCAVHRDSFPISKPVDEIWHVSLLNPVNYAKMETAAGRRFIHNMTLSEEEDQGLLPLYHSRTLPRYEKLFGAPAVRYWPREQCVCTCCDCIEVA